MYIFNTKNIFSEKKRVLLFGLFNFINNTESMEGERTSNRSDSLNSRGSIASNTSKHSAASVGVKKQDKQDKFVKCDNPEMLYMPEALLDSELSKSNSSTFFGGSDKIWLKDTLRSVFMEHANEAKKETKSIMFLSPLNFKNKEGTLIQAKKQEALNTIIQSEETVLKVMKEMYSKMNKRDLTLVLMIPAESTFYIRTFTISSKIAGSSKELPLDQIEVISDNTIVNGPFVDSNTGEALDVFIKSYPENLQNIVMSQLIFNWYVTSSNNEVFKKFKTTPLCFDICLISNDKKQCINLSNELLKSVEDSEKLERLGTLSVKRDTYNLRDPMVGGLVYCNNAESTTKYPIKRLHINLQSDYAHLGAQQLKESKIAFQIHPKQYITTNPEK